MAHDLFIWSMINLLIAVIAAREEVRSYVVILFGILCGYLMAEFCIQIQLYEALNR